MGPSKQPARFSLIFFGCMFALVATGFALTFWSGNHWTYAVGQGLLWGTAMSGFVSAGFAAVMFMGFDE